MLMIGIVRGRRPRRLGIRQLTMLFLAGTLASTLLATASGAEEARPGHAVVFNESITDSQGERHPGSVAWRIDRTKAVGQPDELAIHGDAEIPDMRMKMTIDIRRNTDKSLPATHLVEVTFALPPDVAGGKVIASPGILMKFSERARGTPLTGASIKITDGSFLVGLSGKEADRARNLELLKGCAWFDMPMVYGNQHRGIFAAEKGFHGEDVFNEVMTAWEKSP